MIRVAGIGRSGDRGGQPPPPAPSSSSSTLSPLAPPFTVDRSLPAVTNPNSLAPPPPAGTISPYFVPTGDSGWSSSSSSASSRLTNVKSGFGAAEASRYYPYYTTAVDGNFEKISDYKVYARGWGGNFDLEEGMPARGSLANSSWADSLPSCQMSSALKKRATADSFSAYEDSFGSWHGAHNESSSFVGHVGSECSEWLDDRHQGIYAKKSRAPTDGSCAAELDTTVWPSERSSYFYSPETTSVVKECDTFIPSSYDRYISQLTSGSRDPIVHYPAPTSSRQGYAPSNERNESSLSCSVLKHGNPVIKHVNLHKKNDDYADYVIGMQNVASMYENAEGKEGLEKVGISGDAMQRNSETPGSSLLVKGLSGNSSALGHSVDCLEDVKFGFKIANLSSCNASNSERDAFMPDDSMQASPEISDHLNVSVDSPCWKGASVSRRHPFSSDEILQPLVVSVASGSDDLVQDQRSLKIQFDVEQGGTFVCNENGKVIPSAIPKDLSPVTDLSGSNLNLQDCAGRGSNPAKVDNAKETEQRDIRGEQCSALIEQVSVPQGIDDHVRQLSQAENIICEAGSNTGEIIPAVQNSELGANHISTTNYPSSSNTNASNGEMKLSSLNTISPAELQKPVSSDAPSKCLSQGQDIQVVVKAMLSLSEVLLCHYCNDNEAVGECDHKSVLQIIDNLEAVILRNKKGITPRAEERQPEVKDSNAGTNIIKYFKDPKESKNLIRSGLNNDKHSNILKSNFEESDGMAQAFANVLKSGFLEQEEDPKILLYKNLWVQTEATLCSLKHDVALMKLEMGSFKANEASMENNSKEDEIDSSVFARFRILKGRHEADLADSDAKTAKTGGKGVLQSNNVNKFTVASPKTKKKMEGEKLSGLDHRMGSGLFLNETVPGGAQESHISAPDCSGIHFCNPKNNGKWRFSSGSESSRCSDWEHVVKDEFI